MGTTYLIVALLRIDTKSYPQCSNEVRGTYMDRCSWRSFASFKAYVQASVLSFNLLVLARHLIS